MQRGASILRFTTRALQNEQN
jgi:hypothetical protein